MSHPLKHRSCPALPLLMALVIPFAGTCAAPPTWRWSNPTPHGNTIVDMTLFGGTVVQVADKGQVYFSTDLATWTPASSGTSRALRSVTVHNQRLVITGESGTVLYGDNLDQLTLTNLGTSDWLEGVASSGSLLVAVGDNGAAYTSPDGSAWTRRSSGTTSWLRSVAHGSGRFVAVGENGTIAVSPTGLTWTTRSSGTTRNLNRVAYLGGSFVAVGDAGTVLQNADGTGLVWAPVRSGATNNLNGLALAGTTMIVAGDGEARLRDFSDTQGWLNQLAPTKPLPAPDWTYYSVLWTGSEFLLGGRSGMVVEGYRPNAASDMLWYQASDSIRNWLWDVGRVGDLFVAVGDWATLMTSRDGVDWALEVTPAAATNAVFLGVGGTTNLLLAVGTAGNVAFSRSGLTNIVSTNTANGTVTVTTNTISTFGVLWTTPASPPTTNDLQGVAFLGDRAFVSGGNGTVLTTTNGIDWALRLPPTSVFLSGLTAFAGGIVAVGQQGTILTSPDGVAWTTRSSGTTNWLYRVRNTGNRLIAVGQNGTILTSSDGNAWIKPSSGVTNWLNDVVFVGDSWFVVGNQGTVLVSTNGSTWTRTETLTSKSLYGAATALGRLVAAGYEGVILRSQVVPDPTPVTVRNYSHTARTNAANVFVDVFLASGQVDQRFAIDSSTNLHAWVLGPTLEFTDSTGTLLFYSTTTNPPPRGFFRARLIP